MTNKKSEKRVEAEYIWDALNVMMKFLHSNELNAQPMYDEVNILRLEALKSRRFTLPKRGKK